MIKSRSFFSLCFLPSLAFFSSSSYTCKSSFFTKVVLDLEYLGILDVTFAFWRFVGVRSRHYSANFLNKSWTLTDLSNFTQGLSLKRRVCSIYFEAITSSFCKSSSFTVSTFFCKLTVILLNSHLGYFVGVGSTSVVFSWPLKVILNFRSIIS